MFPFFYPARKEPGFSIGWDNANQMNDFQLRKSKNKEVTGKITTQAIIGGQQMVPQRSPYQQPGTNYYEPQAKDCTPFSIQTNKSCTRTLTSPTKSYRR